MICPKSADGFIDWVNTIHANIIGWSGWNNLHSGALR
jgi:hypothetical protein